MNALEADLLFKSGQGLADTLLRSRMIEEDRRARQEALGLRRQESELDRTERGVDRAMREEEMGENRADRADARKTRQVSLEAQKAHQDRILALQKEQNADNRMKMGIELLTDMNKTGQLTDEGIEVMGRKFSELFAPAGLEVKLFRRAEPPEPTSKDMGGGVRAVYMPGGKETHVIDERSTLQEEQDDFGGPPVRKVTRKVGPKELQEAIGNAERGTRSAESGVFKDEAAARAAGHKAGDIVQLMLNGKPTRVRLK
jgi:hypothetical protein